MRKSWLVAIALLLIVCSSASAIAISRRALIGERTTLTFDLQGVAGEGIDLGAPGESIGDQFVSSSLLLEGGAEVGRVESVCSMTNTDPMTTVCHAALRLDGGQIALMGRVPGEALSGEANIRIAVIGGTGAYRHAHGSATIDTVGSILTLVLTP